MDHSQSPSIEDFTEDEVREEFTCRNYKTWEFTDLQLRSRLKAIVAQIWNHDPLGSGLPALNPGTLIYENHMCQVKWMSLFKEHLTTGKPDPARWILLLARYDRLRRSPPITNGSTFQQLKVLVNAQIKWTYSEAVVGSNSRAPIATPFSRLTPMAAPDDDATDNDLLIISAGPEDSPSAYSRNDNTNPKKKTRKGPRERRAQQKQQEGGRKGMPL